MALPILDGNQSATTLSTIFTSGAHIPAHTVVSLGSQAISDITSGVSGSVVSISNFPPTQTIAGTVTANISAVYAGEASFTQADNPMMAVGGLLQGFNEIRPITIDLAGSQIVAGTVTANVPNADTFIKPSGTGGFGDALEAQDDVSAEMCVAVHIQDQSGNVLGASKDFPISGTVTVGNSTTASAVAVRLIAEDTNPGGSGAGVNVNLYSNDNALLVDALKNGNSVLGYDGLSSYVQVKTAVGSSVTIGSLPAISGTVTANGGDFASKNTDQPSSAIQLGYMTGGGDFLKVNEDGNCFPVRIFTSDGSVGLAEAFIPISGTVTANNPNGALTTRFGSVATANLAFITSAVTNTFRKYLLAQNISAGTVTIGIGFSPTTTQGIQLTAGGGLTFDAFCPTGAVYWLGAVTGAAFTILEG